MGLHFSFAMPKIQLPLPQCSYSYVYLVVVALLFYVHGKHLRSCPDGQLT